MKKKAFTLTELLVVVVIIGVLAAVVLPKFTQVLETRRTTEAEEIMRAVRSEQEARCTLDKNYVGEVDKAELASFPANEGNNYHYTLTATGIAAASRNKNYTLRIQSYRDGEICCDGDDCAHLGKTYPVCPARVVAVDECAAETACNLRSYSEACPSGQEGQVLFVPNADCTGYEQVNQCHDITVDPATCSEGETRHVNRNCAGSSGERCEGGTWKHFASTDDGTPQPGDTTKTCSTGESVTCTYECNTTTGAWDKTCDECRICQEGKEEITSSACGKKSGKRCVSNAWVFFTDEPTDLTQDEKENCTCETKPQDETRNCPDGKTGTQTRTYTCDQSSGEWKASTWTGTCRDANTCPDPSAQQLCEQSEGQGVWTDYPDCKCTCRQGTLVDGECVYTEPEPTGPESKVCNWVVQENYTGKNNGTPCNMCGYILESSGPQNCNESTEGQIFRHFNQYSTCPGGGCMEDLLVQTCVCE
jgi:type IV pilus assembly protein PilE